MGRRAARQLPRHRIHRQARHRAELRKPAARQHRLRGGGDERRRARGAAAALEPRDPRQCPGAVDRHPAAGDGRGAVRRPARCAGGDRSSQRRDPRLRQQAELRSEPLCRRHRRRELEGAERVARQAAAQPGAARRLSTGLHLQAVHGDGGADPGQADAAASDLRPGLFQFRQPPLPRRQGRRPRHGRHVPVDRPVVRHLLLHARQRPRRRPDPRLHGAARPRPAHRYRPERRAARHPALDRVEARRLPQEGSAEVVRRRDDLAGHRPGLQLVHDAAAGPGGGHARVGRPALQAAPGQGDRELRDARAAAPGRRVAAAAGLEARARRLRPPRDVRRHAGGHLGAGIPEHALPVGRQDRHGTGDPDQAGREVRRRQARRAPPRPCALHRLRAAREPADRARTGGRERGLRRRRGGADRPPRVRLRALRPVPERGRHRRDAAGPVVGADRPAAGDRRGAAAGTTVDGAVVPAAAAAASAAAAAASAASAPQRVAMVAKPR